MGNKRSQNGALMDGNGIGLLKYNTVLRKVKLHKIYFDGLSIMNREAYIHVYRS